ncbi:DUF4153 domain-containing protein [Roseimaritima ulvae]|nr:DUF4173 domain-containing protein [Roseimaritima ulvae]
MPEPLPHSQAEPPTDSRTPGGVSATPPTGAPGSKGPGTVEVARPLWDESPTGWREWLAVVLLVGLCDLTIYRGQGYAGYSLLFAAVPWLLVAGGWRPHFRTATWVTGSLLLLVALRLLWSGSSLAVLVGFALVPAFAMALGNRLPYVPEWCRFTARMWVAPFDRLARYHHQSLQKRASDRRPSRWMEVTLPLAALLAFGAIFVFANPSLVRYVTDTAEKIGLELQRWFDHFSMLEVLFWAVTAWLGLALVRPRFLRRLPAVDAESVVDAKVVELQPGETAAGESRLFRPYRNTLLTVVGLFAVYLVFELTTLWFREFPEGFYYAGYAHQGAAWLTIALALATATLSLIFRAEILRDPRRPVLTRLAWIWSIQNFLLALSVFNRMHIYVDFNGMTRMRTIGLFGISTVVVGFVLVLIKISRGKSFLWLVRSQLWALSFAVILYALLPVDMLVHRYNVRRVMNGDVAAAVQISVHPIDDEGYLVLWPLLNCRDPLIENGIRGMLAEKSLTVGRSQSRRRRARRGWTTYQMSEQRLGQQLEANRAELAPLLSDETARTEAIRKFHDYVYQWY